MRKELGITGRGRPQKIVKNDNFSGKNLRDVIALEWYVSNSYVQLALNVKKVSDEFFQGMLEGEKTPSEAEEFLAKLKIKESINKIIPEIRTLFEEGKLPYEDAVHFAQFAEDEQKAVLMIIAEELGISEQTIKQDIKEESSRSSEMERLKKRTGCHKKRKRKFRLQISEPPRYHCRV